MSVLAVVVNFHMSILMEGLMLVPQQKLQNGAVTELCHNKPNYCFHCVISVS
jgi:hypothetical protein